MKVFYFIMEMIFLVICSLGTYSIKPDYPDFDESATTGRNQIISWSHPSKVKY